MKSIRASLTVVPVHAVGMGKEKSLVKSQIFFFSKQYINTIVIWTYLAFHVHCDSVQVGKVYHHSIVRQCKVTVLCSTHTHLKLIMGRN